MGNNYDIIKQLIDLWDTYECEYSEGQDLLSFSEWMVEQIKAKNVSNSKLTKQRELYAYAETETYLNRLSPKSQFQEYILRIARFEEFYIRKYLVDLPLNSRLEYLFLYTVDVLEKARKTDLINIHLSEYTTGMDTIRRLIKNKLLTELPDEEDKRAKRLIITSEGVVVLRQANKQMEEARNMFLACISPNKWKKALSVLHDIDQFHSNMYMKHSDKPAAELSNLMDSLKYHYK